MRKNKKGRLPQYDRDVVKILRDKNCFSFQEIADKLNMKSRQLARYYYLGAVDKNPLTKNCKRV
jgi:hypothetical protein